MSVKNFFRIIPKVNDVGSGLAPGTYLDTQDKARLKAVLQNGVGRYICPLLRITFNLCKEYRSSHGMREFVEKYLVDFSRSNPTVVVYVMPKRHKDPQIVAEYSTGNLENLNVKNYTAEDISKWAHYFLTASGYPVSTIISDTHSENSSIQGIWNPFVTKPTNFNVEKFPSKKYSRVESIAESATITLLKEYSK